MESVYEKALSIELTKIGCDHQCQRPIDVFYEEQLVGKFVSDLLVENRVIVELKAVVTLASAHEVQLVNYLVATKKDVGLLVNFGPAKVEVKRKFRLPKTPST